MEEVGLCVIPIALLVAVFGTIVMLRWFKHREILAMVDKGLLPTPYAQPGRASRGRGLLGWGVGLAMLGLALMIGLWPLGFARLAGAAGRGQYPLQFGPWMLIGLIPLFIGLALLILYFLARREEASAPEPPPAEEVELPGD
jgi:hypothetical protein